ncbi:MAG: NAD-dependent isocitrate dehydrogenase, partial [Clostridium sp.]|nr:NAD-dependent isocitrate dehydrogenase [Clostridium sp.]
MRQTITVFKGDGIGPEITDAVIRVMDAAGAQLEYEIYNVGEAEYEANRALIPKAAFQPMERNKVPLKSTITTPVGKG